MRTAIIPGSFDPMTLGHLDLVLRARKLFDCVIVAVMINDEKKYLFSLAERKRIAELTVGEREGVSVISSEGYLADLAAELGADAIVKGVRNEKDFLYEQEMAVFNRDRNPACETVYLPAYGKMTQISSTAVRRRLEDGADTEELLAPAAAAYVAASIKKKRKGAGRKYEV